MRCATILALLGLLPLTRVAAQRLEAPVASRIAAAYGAHYGAPLRFSLSLGTALDLDQRRTQGVLALLEQGQQGSELSAGWFRTIGRYGSGVSLRGALLRTAGEPWEANPHTTYAGAELHWMVLLGVGGRVGWLRRVSSNADGTHDALMTVGLSVGQ